MFNSAGNNRRAFHARGAGRHLGGRSPQPAAPALLYAEPPEGSFALRRCARASSGQTPAALSQQGRATTAPGSPPWLRKNFLSRQDSLRTVLRPIPPP